MRFHIGLSLNWKTIKKWILPILIGILLFLGFRSNMQVHALTPTINKQAYYYHANQITQTNNYCITSADSTSCQTTEATGSSPWLVGTDLSFSTDLQPGQFSGTAVIYLHVTTPTPTTFYNRNITASNVNIGIGIGDVEFPQNNANVTDIEITNFKIENIVNEGVDGGILSDYVSKVTFSYTAYTTLTGTYYVKIGVSATAGTDGLFQQLNGNAYEEAMLNFTGLSTSSYKSKLTFTSGSLTDEKLDNLNESIQQGNQEIKDELGNVGDKIEGSIDNAKDEINDTIKDSFEDCRDSYNLLSLTAGSLTVNGITFSYSSGTGSFVGTATNESNVVSAIGLNRFANYIDYGTISANRSFLLQPGTYTISISSSNSNTTMKSFVLVVGDLGQNIRNGATGYYLNNNNKSYTFTLTESKYVMPAYYLYGSSPETVYFTGIMLNEGSSAKPYEEYGKEVCQNRIDETNDQLGNLNDNITNGNIDSGTGNSFFDNFQTEDNGGISGIITAPLTLINSLLDGQGTCTDLKFPIMGKEVSMPSGCIIWDKVPNEMEILIQTLVCGTGAYFLLKQLFKDIEKLKNPNNSEVSTLDL